MERVRLLERLSALEDPRQRSGLNDEQQLRDSIVHYLESLLNTRAGSVPIDPGYGMPDMSNIAGSFAAGTSESLAQAIAHQVSTYEPRLRDISVMVEREQRDVITLRFALHARLRSRREEAQAPHFAVTLRINSVGRVTVEPLTRHA